MLRIVWFSIFFNYIGQNIEDDEKKDEDGQQSQEVDQSKQKEDGQQSDEDDEGKQKKEEDDF